MELERPKNVLIHEWSLLQRARKKASEAAAVINSYKSDFDRFFDDPVIVQYEACEDWCLQWWKANQFQYKQVAKAARDLLAIPIVEVNMKRLFSEGRDVLSIRRIAVDGETMRVTRLIKSYYD